MQIKLFAVLLLAQLYTAKLHAQSCALQLHGKVVDATSGEPIEAARVFIIEQKVSTYSDANGEFLLSHLCGGEITLACQHLNHVAKKEKLVLRSSLRNKSIFMTCHVDSLHQVVIKGARIHWEDIHVAHTMQGDDLAASAGLSLGKALEKVNGIHNLSTGNNIQKPIIRGMHSNRVLIVNNEIRQEGQQWGNEHAPEIDPAIAQRIEVIKGAQTVRYGSDVIGGVILIHPKPMKDISGIKGELQSSFISNGAAWSQSFLVEGRYPKKGSGITARLQGTLKRAGNGKTPDYYLKNTGLKESNYSMSVGYQKKGLETELFHSYFNTDIGIFSGSHIGNLSDLYQAFQATKPLDNAGFSYQIDLPYQHVEHQLYKVKTNYFLEKIGLLKMIIGYQSNQRKEFDKTLKTKQEDGSYKPALHFRINTLNYDICLEHRIKERVEGTIGIQGFTQQNNYFGSYFIPNFQKQTGGIYLIEKWHAHKISAEAGIRYDIQQFNVQKWEQNQLITPSHFFHGLASSAAVRYQIPYVTLHVNMGTAWRAPYVNELYSYGVHHSAASFEIGDRTIGSERSYSISSTLDFNYKKKIDVELTFFANYMQNYINLQPTFPATLTIRGAFPTYQYAQIDAKFSGVEFSATSTLFKHIRWHIRANKTNAIQVANKQFLVGIPPARMDNELEFLCRSNKLHPFSILIGHTYTAKQYRVANSADYVPAPPAYSLYKMELQYSLSFVKTKMDLHLGIQNLWNNTYRDYVNRNRYFANEIGRTAYIRLRIPFVLYQEKQTSYDVLIVPIKK